MIFDVHGRVLCFVYFQLNYIDEVDQTVLMSLLKLNFKKIFAMLVVKVIAKKCNGCVLDLPSKLDHIFLNFNVLEDMNVYWAEALASVDFGSVSFEYYTWAEAQNLSCRTAHDGRCLL